MADDSSLSPREVAVINVVVTGVVAVGLVYMLVWLGLPQWMAMLFMLSYVAGLLTVRYLRRKGAQQRRDYGG